MTTESGERRRQKDGPASEVQFAHTYNDITMTTDIYISYQYNTYNIYIYIYGTLPPPPVDLPSCFRIP